MLGEKIVREDTFVFELNSQNTLLNHIYKQGNIRVIDGMAVEEKKNIRIAVDSTGALFLDGEAVKDEELESKLKVLKDVNPEALIVIEADEKSLHGKVVFVIDKAKSADYTRFAIATEEVK